MGNFMSGWYGRRSARPFFDELPRIAIGDIPAEDAGATWLLWQGAAVRVVRVPQGFGQVARLICSRCDRTCTVIYFAGAPCCYRCTGARYRSHSESPSRRALRRAKKIWRRCIIDFKRPEGKPRWQRWPTFEKLSAEADAVWPTIERAECAPYDVLQRVMDLKPRRRGRPKNTAG